IPASPDQHEMSHKNQQLQPPTPKSLVVLDLMPARSGKTPSLGQLIDQPTTLAQARVFLSLRAWCPYPSFSHAMPTDWCASCLGTGHVVQGSWWTIGWYPCICRFIPARDDVGLSWK